MSTPFPQSSLDQAARDAAANKPQNILQKWVKQIKSMKGSQPAPTSSQAQTARDARAGGKAMREYARTHGGSRGGGGANVGGLTTALSTGAAIGTHMRETMPQSTFVSGRGSGARATNNPRKNSPDPEYPQVSNTSATDKPIPPRTGERKPGPWDEGYVKPGASSFMDPIAPPDANPGRLATDPPRTRDVVPPRQSTVTQSGTQTGPTSTPIDMSRGFDAMIGDLGLSDYANFSSNQLPTTGANPFTATPAVTPGFGEEIPDIGGYNGATHDSKQGAEAAGSRDLTQFAPTTGEETRIEGASDRKKGGSLSEALADTAGINSYMSKFSSGDRQRAADRAFLDAPTSMEGLRRKEAVNGVVYASGNHYIDGGKGNPAQKLDTRQEARDIADGKTTASALLEKYKNRITESQSDAPVKAQEPETSADKPDVKQDFSRSETISTPINTDIPGNVEFESNNDDTLPGFGNTGGWKTTSKKPEVDYSSIFSY